MQIQAAMEYNDGGVLLYALELPGAYGRGKTLEQAREKFGAEARSWFHWAEGKILPAEETVQVEITEKKESILQVCDADSDMIFASERTPFTPREYERLKMLAISSAAGFEKLYDSIPEKGRLLRPARETFYGSVPCTAREMYCHTNGVTAYYFREVGVEAENLPQIFEGRLAGLEQMEQNSDFMENPVFLGSFGEEWSAKKMLRRFIWHDRIHAKAMYRRARAIWGERIENPFFF